MNKTDFARIYRKHTGAQNFSETDWVVASAVVEFATEQIRAQLATARLEGFNEGINEAIKVCESLSDWRTLRNPSPDKYVEKIIELKKGEV